MSAVSRVEKSRRGITASFQILTDAMGAQNFIVVRKFLPQIFHFLTTVLRQEDCLTLFRQQKNLGWAVTSTPTTVPLAHSEC